MYFVDSNVCPQNHRCPLVRICPMDAISQEGFNLPKIDPDRCIRCGKCESSCPMHAVKEQ